MTADRLHRATGKLGKMTRSHRPAVIEKNDELVDHRITEEPQIRDSRYWVSSIAAVYGETIIAVKRLQRFEIPETSK